MPNVDVQWPSEDEDFDAVSTNYVNSPSAASPEVSRPVAPRAVRVQDVSEVQQAPEPAVPEAAPVEAHEAHDDQPYQDQEEQPVAQEEQVVPAAESQPETPLEAPEAPEAAQAVPETAPQEQWAPEAAPAVEPEAPVQDVKPAKVKKVKAPKAPRAPGARRPYVHYAIEALLLIALIGAGYYAYTLQGDKKALKGQISELNANPQVAVQKQTNSLISTVGSLMQLPTGETPTIANVTNASQAKQQSAFFNNAQNGDKVLMYVKAGEAILYRPSTNRIVLVAPLTFSNTAATTTKK